MTEQDKPSAESKDPVPVGDILPGVLKDIVEREIAREVMDEQQAVYGKPDHKSQEALQEANDKLDEFNRRHPDSDK